MAVVMDKDCAICIGVEENLLMCRGCTTCKLPYHVKCLAIWERNKPKCPTCPKPIWVMPIQPPPSHHPSYRLFVGDRVGNVDFIALWLLEFTEVEGREAKTFTLPVQEFLRRYIVFKGVQLERPNVSFEGLKSTLGRVLCQTHLSFGSFGHGPTDPEKRYRGFQLNNAGAAAFQELMGYDLYAKVGVNPFHNPYVVE